MRYVYIVLVLSLMNMRTANAMEGRFDPANDHLSDDGRQEYRQKYPDVFCYPQSVLSFINSSLNSKKPKTFASRSLVFHEQRIRDVVEHLKSLIIFGDDPGSILVILALDGTITDTQMPVDDPKLRAGVDELLYFIKQEKINIIFSSAWNDPIESALTYRKLGLDKFFGYLGFSLEQQEIPLSNIQYYSMGPLCGIRQKHEQWFKHKALASLLFYSERQIKNLKHVIFVDDNERNIELFNEEISLIGLPQDSQIVLFHLKPPVQSAQEESSDESLEICTDESSESSTIEIEIASDILSSFLQ